MSSLPSSVHLDILAIAAHRDDVEQTCGGTLRKAAKSGQRTGILDLTQGEMGTRGSAEDRAREADDAAKILSASWRRALDLPDGRVENTWENRLKVASVIRETKPRVIILPYWKGRHPDHYTASVLGYEACFLAGLKKLDPAKIIGSQPVDISRQKSDFASLPLELPPHRPFKIVYATSPHAICSTATTTPKASVSRANGRGEERRYSASPGKFSQSSSRRCARASIPKAANSSDSATAQTAQPPMAVHKAEAETCTTSPSLLPSRFQSWPNWVATPDLWKLTGRPFRKR